MKLLYLWIVDVCTMRRTTIYIKLYIFVYLHFFYWL